MLPVPAQPPEPTIASLREAPGASGEADGDALGPYWTFYWAVAAAQLARWLPREPARVLDLSGGGGRFARQAARSGHTVVEVLDRPPAAPAPEPPDGALNGSAPGAGPTPPARPPDEPPADGGPQDAAPPDGRPPEAGLNGSAARAPAGAARIPGLVPARPAVPPGAVQRVVGDPGAPAFLADASVDAVVAENRMLSRHLVAESTVAEIARVLRPGGRVLLTVDSLTLGMALLAEQNCWAHLSDVPRAEVVLVPWPDGTITRCFQTDELRELLADAGLEVEWIRPRTALSASTVEHVLATSPSALPRLVRTELNVPPGDESLGIHLLASAVRV
ncbi:methyltransferase domain-containing protein [Actinomadura rupiterrae]|uniref:methyltransferase domain-containing protein n=1 Tax=Actinomadura rupiterrae TaxID=559627 RepID=UPI0020A30DCF|nr:methyltransferase domain-containing protein [Actinomadura rupiterrae]MCP2340104.1 SAM-dependent methyltransferase [Actinomadura rupiterrae]